jgi:hypothetical protein
MARKEVNKIIFVKTGSASLLIATRPYGSRMMSKNIAGIFTLKEMVFLG